MAVTLRYFTEFGKPVFQHITALICGGIYAWVKVKCDQNSIISRLYRNTFLQTHKNIKNNICFTRLIAQLIYVSIYKLV